MRALADACASALTPLFQQVTHRLDIINQADTDGFAAVETRLTHLSDTMHEDFLDTQGEMTKIGSQEHSDLETLSTEVQRLEQTTSHVLEQATAIAESTDSSAKDLAKFTFQPVTGFLNVFVTDPVPVSVKDPVTVVGTSDIISGVASTNTILSSQMEQQQTTATNTGRLVAMTGQIEASLSVLESLIIRPDGTAPGIPTYEQADVSVHCDDPFRFHTVTVPVGSLGDDENGGTYNLASKGGAIRWFMPTTGLTGPGGKTISIGTSTSVGNFRVMSTTRQAFDTYDVTGIDSFTHTPP